MAVPSGPAAFTHSAAMVAPIVDMPAFNVWLSGKT